MHNPQKETEKLMCSDENNIYDNTVSESMEESILKALELFEQQQKEQEKKIVRPSITFKEVMLSFLPFFLVYLALGGLVFGVCYFLNLSGGVFGVLIALLTVIFLAVKAKSIMKNLVLLYQKYAPEKLRRSCLYTPSCSEYMLLALDKYGFIKGTFKGISRLFRCHPPNGGEDLP